MRPDLNRVPEYFHQYIVQVKQNNFVDGFKWQEENFIKFLQSIPPDKYDYRYAEDKWTLKEVLQHMIDTERVFNYRALWFARKNETPLPGFDQLIFAANAPIDHRTWEDLVAEFQAVRKGTEMLFGSFTEEELDQTGTASGNQLYVLGIAFIILGHVEHHVRIIKTQYLVNHSNAVSI